MTIETFQDMLDRVDENNTRSFKALYLDPRFDRYWFGTRSFLDENGPRTIVIAISTDESQILKVIAETTNRTDNDMFEIYSPGSPDERGARIVRGSLDKSLRAEHEYRRVRM